jgi:CheY-like chemotaxis protein
VLNSSIKNVLIADDSATDRVNLSHTLEKLDLKVTSVKSGNKATLHAKGFKPDVIFLDVIMDEGDGFHACRTLKRDDSTAKIPVIIVSSKSNRIDKLWAKKLGANGFHSKPLNQDKLIHTINSLI